MEIPTRGAWRAQLERILARTRRVLLGHPSLVPLFLARQSTSPNALRLGEAMLAQLHQARLDDREAATALSRHPADEVFTTGPRWLLDRLAPP